jgi:hypothetical protein
MNAVDFNFKFQTFKVQNKQYKFPIAHKKNLKSNLKIEPQNQK